MKRRIDTWQISAFHQHLKEEERESSTTPAMAFCFFQQRLLLIPKMQILSRRFRSFGILNERR